MEDSVRSVKRAFSILLAFTRDDYKLTLSEIAERISLPVTTTLRLANTLESLGILQRHSDRAYSLGSKLYLLGNVAKANFRPQQIIYPYMKSIRDATREAVSLYGIEGQDRVCYEHIDSLLSMRCVVRVGDRMPIWAGAGGKALLAFLDADTVEAAIAQARPLTSTTISKREDLLKEFAGIRALGYATSHGENEEGIYSIAVPIFNRRGEIVFSFSVAGPASRFTEEIAQGWTPRIQAICREISNQI